MTEAERNAAEARYVRRNRIRTARVVIVTVAAIIGATVAFAALISSYAEASSRQALTDCLQDWAQKSADRATALTPVGNLRTAADNARTAADNVRQGWNSRVVHWQGVEQQIFLDSFAQSKSRAELKAEFRRAARHDHYASRKYAAANRDYGKANRRYKRINTEYRNQSKLHPVPKLQVACKGSGLGPRVVHVTSTATTTHTAHATRTVHAPPRTRVVVVPHTRVVTHVRTVYVHGHRRHR